MPFYRRLSAVSSFTLSPLGLEVRVFVPEYLDRVTTSWVRALLKYLTTEPWKYMSAPSPSVDRGDDGRVCLRCCPSSGTASSAIAMCTVTSVAFPFLHVPARSTELPATTVGESSRGGSLRRHKAGLWTVFNELAWCPGVSLRIRPVGWEVRWPNVTSMVKGRPSQRTAGTDPRTRRGSPTRATALLQVHPLTF